MHPMQKTAKVKQKVSDVVFISILIYLFIFDWFSCCPHIKSHWYIYLKLFFINHMLIIWKITILWFFLLNFLIEMHFIKENKCLIEVFFSILFFWTSVSRQWHWYYFPPIKCISIKITVEITLQSMAEMSPHQSVIIGLLSSADHFCMVIMVAAIILWHQKFSLILWCPVIML